MPTNRIFSAWTFPQVGEGYSPFLRCFIVFCENARQPKTRNWKFLIEKVCFGFHLSNRKRQSERAYLLFRNKLYLCTD